MFKRDVFKSQKRMVLQSCQSKHKKVSWFVLFLAQCCNSSQIEASYGLNL